jgi:hypothetical protein
MRSWGLVSLGLAFVLAGCGTGGAGNMAAGLPTFEVPKLDSEREQFLASFPVVNDAEEESAPLDPRTNRAPFGVLIHMASFGQGTFCSVAHVSPGRVTTNAHCVSRSSAPHEYFVVFYNNRNWKRYERVTNFVYVGNQESDDVAVLQIDPDAARSWDTVSGATVNSSAEIGAPAPALHKATIWSFNPFKENHPALYQKYNGSGMRFTPKHCDASRTRPSLTGISADGEGAETGRIRIVSGVSQEKIHWFVDACDKRPVHGNSGSLITSVDDITQIYGAYHWNIPADRQKMSEYARFEYRGNNGTAVELNWADLKKRDFFGVGTDFNALLASHPGLF